MADSEFIHCTVSLMRRALMGRLAGHTSRYRLLDCLGGDLGHLSTRLEDSVRHQLIDHVVRELSNTGRIDMEGCQYPRGLTRQPLQQYPVSPSYGLCVAWTIICTIPSNRS